MVSWYGMYYILHGVLKMDFVLEDLKIKYILMQASRHMYRNYVFLKIVNGRSKLIHQESRQNTDLKRHLSRRYISL